MGNGEYAKQVDAFDPLGSIFLPQTNKFSCYIFIFELIFIFFEYF